MVLLPHAILMAQLAAGSDNELFHFRFWTARVRMQRTDSRTTTFALVSGFSAIVDIRSCKKSLKARTFRWRGHIPHWFVANLPSLSLSLSAYSAVTASLWAWLVALTRENGGKTNALCGVWVSALHFSNGQMDAGSQASIVLSLLFRSKA